MEWVNRCGQVGINLGAPGDRRADNGTLWLENPGIGGPSPDIPVEIEGNDLHYIRRHSWFLEASDNLPWVSASAVTGISNLTYYPQCEIVLYLIQSIL